MDLSHRYTRLIIDECKEHGLLRNQCAYVLATAWHETGKYRWLREIWGPSPAQKRYEGRKDLGNVTRGDGKKFMGRGFVQITGRRNYTDWAKRTGLPLTDKPELAEKPEVAVGILVQGMKLGTFTGKKLSDYITLAKSQFYDARRIVNGRDRAALIADYARQFDKLLMADGYGEASPAAVNNAIRDKMAEIANKKPQPAPRGKPEANGGLLSLILELMRALFGKAKGGQ